MDPDQTSYSYSFEKFAVESPCSFRLSNAYANCMLHAVGDSIKESTPAALTTQKQQGLKLVVLTGDAKGTAAAVGPERVIDEVIAEVKPAQHQPGASAPAAARGVVLGS